MTWLLERKQWGTLAGAALLALAAVAVYANTASAPFVFDDQLCIVDNPTIRHLWPPWSALSPPHGGGLTVDGRPVVNLSLAINYAISGYRVWSYHAFNVLIHLLAGLTLFAIVRRTANSSVGVAFAIALLWTVHPLQTESVTYTIQRAESLMGLFYLLTLYCFIRSVSEWAVSVPPSTDSALLSNRLDGLRSGSLRGFRSLSAVGPRNAQSVPLPKHSIRWEWLSVACCLCGMATKEVMVSAPVMVLFYDRTFIAGSFAAAWRQRRGFYLSLAATWLLLLALVLHSGTRGGTTGFGNGVAPWDYWLTQPKAIVRYLALTFWPHPLVFDYTTYWVTGAAQVIPFAAVVILLVAATAVALWRWPAWGFLGLWFFAILAPTSVVPGTTQMIADHRMYLALAAVLTAVVFALRLGRAAARSLIALVVVAAAAFGAATIRRNADYASDVSLWADTAAKSPGNARAQSNLGVALAAIPGRLPDAVSHYEAALRINPDYADAHFNLANALVTLPGRTPEALVHYEAVLRLLPNHTGAHTNLAHALQSIPGRTSEAVAHYEAALRIDPDLLQAQYDLALLLAMIPGRQIEAVTHYEAALRIDPNLAAAHVNLANVLATMPGRLDEAIGHDETALRMEPNNPATHYNLAVLYARAGRIRDAMAHFEATLKLNPAFPQARDNLSQLQAMTKE